MIGLNSVLFFDCMNNINRKEGDVHFLTGRKRGPRRVVPLIYDERNAVICSANLFLSFVGLRLFAQMKQTYEWRTELKEKNKVIEEKEKEITILQSNVQKLQDKIDNAKF